MTIISAQKCVSTEPWFIKHILSDSQPGLVYRVMVSMPGDPSSEYICDCKGFEYKGHCKHQTSFEVCGWEQVVGPEKQTDQQKADKICPRCTNDTVETLEYEEN